MIDPKIFEGMAEKLANSLPPGLLNFKDELAHNFKNILQSTFSKLDLVTRDEFDIQKNVLLKTREKIEALEQKIKALEDKKNHH